MRVATASQALNDDSFRAWLRDVDAAIGVFIDGSDTNFEMP